MSKSKSISPEQSVAQSLDSLFKDTPFFIMGVSGGVDSMSLMYMLHRLGVKALIVHLNYGLRDKESDLDQELVEGMAIEWGFDCQTFKVDFSESKENNVQKWARDQRYSIFRELKEAYSADAIMTAHHQGDQVETILQKLFRGSTPTTWKGMSVLESDIYRPLLAFSKETIQAYALEHAVPFREDQSNSESKYARNFIRNELGTHLDSLFPGWKQNILNLEPYGIMVGSVLEEISDQVLVDERKISLTALSEIDEELRKAVLKIIIERETKETLTRGQVQEVTELAGSQTGKSLELSNGYIVLIDREYMIIHQEYHDEFDSKELDYADIKEGFNTGSISIGFTDQVTPDMLYMDANDLAYPLHLRTWTEGDKFVPFGMDNHQKVSDHLTNRKISTANRKKTLVLCGADDTIYAIIFANEVGNTKIGTISNKVACDGSTEEYLVIQKEALL